MAAVRPETPTLSRTELRGPSELGHVWSCCCCTFRTGEIEDAVAHVRAATPADRPGHMVHELVPRQDRSGARRYVYRDHDGATVMVGQPRRWWRDLEAG